MSSADHPPSLPASVQKLVDDSPLAKKGHARRSAIIELGAHIKRAREAAGFDQTKLAALVGTSQSHLSDMERGTGPQGPTYGMLLRIADACKTTVSALIEPAKPDLAEAIRPGRFMVPGSQWRKAPSVVFQIGLAKELQRSFLSLHKMDQRRVEVIAHEINAASVRGKLPDQFRAWFVADFVRPLVENLPTRPASSEKLMHLLRILPSADVYSVTSHDQLAHRFEETEPGRLKTAKGEVKHYGVPYGARARMILLYLQTQAVRTNSPQVALGRKVFAVTTRSARHLQAHRNAAKE